MHPTPKIIGFAAALSLLGAFLSQEVTARPRSQVPPSNIYAGVIIYDAIPGQENALERELMADMSSAENRRFGIINDRALRSVDPISSQFATYTKFSDAADAERFLNARLNRVKDYVRRAPESHLLRLETSYTPSGKIGEPNGKDFGYKEIGQTAHIFFGLPDPNYGEEYFEALADVKQMTLRLSPKGWLGDDLLSSGSALQPESLAPYTPRPIVATTLSTNYAEYTSFENAENAYLNRQHIGDPSLIEVQRVFTGALQIPARLYIFRVIANQ